MARGKLAGRDLLNICGAQMTALASVSIFSLAFSPLGRARFQSAVFMASMTLLLAIPVLAVLLYL